jgi:hypothetical protein
MEDRYLFLRLRLELREMWFRDNSVESKLLGREKEKMLAMIKQSKPFEEG